MQCTIKATSLAASALALWAAGLDLVAAAPSPTPPSAAASQDLRLAPGLDVGMWVWHREEVVDPSARTRLLEFCRTYGITRLLVQVRFENDTSGPRLATPDAWRALLRDARAAGVLVEALDGASEMGFAANRPETLRRLAAVLDFHRGEPASAGFAGFHYDIEPYTSARWKQADTAGQREIMREFLETAAAINEAVRAVDPKLVVSHDIPAFYDGQERYLVEFGGVTKNFHEHVQDLSDYTGIMSYRTRATGANSVASISAGELAYAARIGKPVYLSLETVPLKETPQITFHGRTPAEYRQTIRELAGHFAGNAAFGGLLLHQYRSMRTLLENPAAPAPGE